MVVIEEACPRKVNPQQLDAPVLLGILIACLAGTWVPGTRCRNVNGKSGKVTERKAFLEVSEGRPGGSHPRPVLSC